MRVLVGKARAGLQAGESTTGDSVALLRPSGGTILELQDGESTTGNLVWVGRVTCGITCIGAMPHSENLHRSTLLSLAASGPRGAVRTIALAMRA